MTFFLVHGGRYVSRLTSGFAAYYGFSKMLLDGLPLSNAYAYEYFNAQLREYGFTGIWDIEYNLPSNSLPFLPFAFLSPHASKIAWTVASLILYLLSVRMLLLIHGIEWWSNLGLSVIALAALWRPSYHCIAHGQMYFLVLFLFTLALRGLVRKRVSLVSIPLASAFFAKGYGVISILWLMFNGRTRMMLTTILIVVAAMVVTLPIIHLDAWVTYWNTVASDFGSLAKSGRVAYQTLTSLILHLFSYDSRWLPSPLIELPTHLVRLLIFLTNVGLTVFALTAARSNNSSLLPISFSIGIAINVVTAPMAEEYHFVLVLPLAISFLCYFFSEENSIANLDLWKIIVIVSIIVLAVPIGYKSLQDSSFPLYLMAYPKLYAALLLIVGSLFATRKTKT
ncbi:MAG: DUF2029 domain-containing protein [Ignavibacteriales bacterium]|nr:DUF2029 domain-containing protein [Ignavibacteriales bacterium]